MNPFFLALMALTIAPFSNSEPFETLPVFDFSSREQADAWRPIHDGIMGGVSRGRSRATDDSVLFTGDISLDNNGGFASFRVSQRLPDLSEYDGIRLRVKGDGQVYRIGLRLDPEWDRMSWRAPFETIDGEWQTIDLAFEDFFPSWRGRLVASESRLDTSEIYQFGLMIADKQAGPFRIELSSVEAWRCPDTETPDLGSVVAARTRTAELARKLDEGIETQRLLEEWQGSERLLVITTPNDGDPEGMIQVGRFLSRYGEMCARDLRVVQLMGARGGRVAGRTLTSTQVKALRKVWALSRERWSVALVGKDGEVKARWRELIEPEEAFDRIDTMPIRRRELAERKGN